MLLRSIVTIPRTLLFIAGLLIIGCQNQTVNIRNADPSAAKPKSPIVAMIGSKTIRRSDIWGSLVELGGETILQNITLQIALEIYLAERSILITQDDLTYEQNLLSTYASDVDMRTFQKMFEAKGFGEHRLEKLFWRNAALRVLVSKDIIVSDNAVKKMYSIIHGVAYPAKVIVVTTLQEASDIKAELSGEISFSDIAVRSSIDPSSIAGGIVAPISLADPAWPSSIRDALPQLEVDEVSDPILIGDRWILLMVTDTPSKSEVTFAEVESEMRNVARLAQERFRMEKLSTSLLQKYTPVLFDADLKRVLRSNTNNPY